MSDTIKHRMRELSVNLDETFTRIRRYRLDRRLREFPATPSGPVEEKHLAKGGMLTPQQAAELRERLKMAWEKWLTVREQVVKLAAEPKLNDLAAAEKSLLELDHEVDLVQCELLSPTSFRVGVRTVLVIAGALVLFVLCYLVTHGMRGLDFAQFEPWPEWGPLKYGEVVFWSTFGVLSWLLFLGSWYLKRRDFDEWYQPWYLTTALRAPFLTVVLMLIILEFVEWYGQGTWMQNYLLEEGNKFYFIAFMSFCLGLASDRTSRIIGDLAEGVGDFVEAAVDRVTQWLKLGVSKGALPQK